MSAFIRDRRCRIGIVYRCAFYAMAGAPIWGAAVTLAIVWHRARF